MSWVKILLSQYCLYLPSHHSSNMNITQRWDGFKVHPHMRESVMRWIWHCRFTGVKDCLTVSEDKNNLSSTFVSLERCQLCNLIWCDMTIAVFFLNIFVSCSIQPVTLPLYRLLMGPTQTFSSFEPHLVLKFGEMRATDLWLNNSEIKI